jgi:hypothetical protein
VAHPSPEWGSFDRIGSHAGSLGTATIGESFGCRLKTLAFRTLDARRGESSGEWGRVKSRATGAVAPDVVDVNDEGNRGEEDEKVRTAENGVVEGE